MSSRVSREAEALRYLGYGRTAPDAAVGQMVRECFEELDAQTAPRSVYEVYALKTDGKRITIGPFAAKSENLAKNLQDCDRIIVFAATLGAAADRMQRKYERIHIAKAAVMQACAAAQIEKYCDAVQERIAKEAEQEGYFLRPRFSPGYGDFGIAFQKELLELVQAQKRIGLSLTDASMLVPVKSVTAVIGMSRQKTECAREGCERCGKKDCRYRRDTKEEGET